MGLESRTALITGGARGIGRATAFALAEAGVSVGIVARSADQVDATVGDLRAAGHRAHGASGDVAQIESLRAAVDEVRARLGPVDILVNNAGVTWPLGPVWEADTEQWLEAVSINLVGPMRAIRLLVPDMVGRGWGRVVNVTTGAATPPGMPRAAAYSASKAGLNQLTLTAATELTDTGVTVNAVDPGPVDTPMQDYMRGQSELLGPDVSAMFQRFHESGQLRDPAEPARLIAALVDSPVTGEVVKVGSARSGSLLGTA